MDARDAHAVADLAGLALKFAATDRKTFWPDRVTPESDTDHTVMLGLIACAVAHKHAQHLDIGKIAQFSLVHDLVEAYAGDTDTFGGLSEAAVADKEERELAALKRIEKEFGTSLPWVPETIKAYESLETPEARFIKVLDKCMPKVTRLLNSHTFTTLEEFESFCAMQKTKMQETYGHDQEVAIALYEHLRDQVVEKLKAATD